MMISLTAFMGSKPAASYFKRDFCTAHLHQKVPKIFELFWVKKELPHDLLTVWEKLFVEITGKVGFFTRKYNKCRICIVDKFGNYHGRGRRLRTLGLRFWRPPLYQLSYSPMKKSKNYK